MAAAGVPDTRVPGYLGRVLDGDSAPVGTCFQVAPGVLVTAWHVLFAIGAADQDAQVRVDPLASGEAFEAAVARLDQAHDLAVLISGVPLPATVGELAATDQMAPRTGVTVTGHSVIADPGRTARSLTTIGQWTGSAIWENATPTGRMTAEALMPGMSGAPVIRDSDGAVAGVVSGRYNTADGWLAGTVWVARTEDLVVLLEGIAEVAAQDAGAARPAGSVRVSEADPRRLGVHAAISVAGVPDEVLPEYVPRDVDAAEHGVRAKVAVAAERGGFVLLVGGSSVGKTRCVFEAVKALLPDWWLVHPAGPAEVAVLAETPSPRTVVWLDELQRYLDGEHGLTGGVVRALLNAPHPVAIIGTLWPDRYTAYAALPTPGGVDSYAREREVLDLAAVIRINPEFSPAEQDRARAVAVHDPRLRVALESAGYGLTQTLAAAPQLVARWQDAQTAAPYAWAVLTAALDVARLGARAPLGADFLRAAAPGYCTSQQQAEAPENWFEQALDYATGKLHGAAAALSPAGARMGEITGYTVADYLIQQASRERRSERVPASTWDAVLSCLDYPADAARLADGAKNRLLYRYAIPLYRHAADAGDENAASQLADLLAGRRDLDSLRARAGAGDGWAAWKLVDLLKERGDLDGAEQVLRASADFGDTKAIFRLASLLEERGDLDGAEQVLRARADVDWSARQELTRLLADRGDLEGLRARADAGDEDAASRLAWLLADRGDLEGLRARADAGDEDAASRLARLLVDRGDLDELRARADADNNATWGLAWLLAHRGDLDELRARADADEGAATFYLAWLLADRDDLEGLRARADAGDVSSAGWLARKLADRDDLEGLRARAEAGDKSSAGLLTKLLVDRGDLDVLRARADAEDEDASEQTPATLQLARLLVDRGDLDELRTRANAGDHWAASGLAHLLAKRGDLEEAEQMLRARADAGDASAGGQLTHLLVDRGELDRAEQMLRAWADADVEWAARVLADLLADRGDLDGLRARANAGDKDAAERLPDLLIKQGRGEEAERLRRFGLNPDGSIACA